MEIRLFCGICHAELTDSVNVLLASEFDMLRTFDLPKPDSDRPEERCRILGDQLMERCPNLHTVASTLREVHSADCNGWSACLNCRGTFYTSKKYEIGHIVDRIGAGDAFIGALVYGLEHYGPGQQAGVRNGRRLPEAQHCGRL